MDITNELFRPDRSAPTAHSKKTTKTRAGAKAKDAAQPAAEPTAEAQPATAAAEVRAVDDAEVTYALASLVARAGDATLDEVDAFLEGLTDDDLVSDGATVATSRVTTDCARLYGIASDFWLRATPAQKDLLAAVSTDRLRISIWSAAQGESTEAALASQAGGAAVTQAAGAKAAAALRKTALDRRDQLERALMALAGRDAALLHRVQKAYGSAAAPGQALEDLAALGQQWLAAPTAGMKIRMRGARVTAAWLADCAALGGKARLAVDSGTAPRRATEIAQADVDRWDGRNLELLRELMALFDAGHATDASIPRLQPIALRTHFGRRRAPPPQPPAPPPVPSPRLRLPPESARTTQKPSRARRRSARVRPRSAEVRGTRAGVRRRAAEVRRKAARAHPRAAEARRQAAGVRLATHETSPRHIQSSLTA
jgi:hypothetical protein